jgi:hypothetical protein
MPPAQPSPVPGGDALHMQAHVRYGVGMKQQAGGNAGSSRRRTERRRRGTETPTRQYTVRAVPAHVDRALRRKAATEKKSLNALLREALIKEAGVAEPSGRLYTDLDGLAGTWLDDPGFDEALRVQDQVDASLWR